VQTPRKVSSGVTPEAAIAKALTPIAIENLRPRPKRYEIPDGGCRGLRVVVQPSGFRSWAVRYRFRGATRKLVLGPVLVEDHKRDVHPDVAGTLPVIDTPLTLTDARWLATQALRQSRSGIDPAPLKQQNLRNEPLHDTVQAVGEEYLRREGPGLRTLAQRRYDHGLIYKSLGSRPIADVKLSDIVRLLDRVEEAHGAAAADRVHASWRRLATWHASRSDEYRPPLVRGAKRNKNGARERVLNDDEIRHVWAAAETLPGPFGAYLKFLLLTAARRKEASDMRRSELVDDATWVIPAARCKTARDVLVPLSRAALAIVRDMPRLGNGDLVFTTDGRTAIGSFSRSKRAIDLASGVTGWTIHDLRRTARTLLSRAGVDADISERCLGHAIGGVRATYDRHQFEPEKRRAFELLAAMVERIVSPQPNVLALTAAR
jgi:integrase